MISPAILCYRDCLLGGRVEVAAPIFIQEYRPALTKTPDRESGVIAMPAEVTNDAAVPGRDSVVNGMASRNHIQLLAQASAAGGGPSSPVASGNRSGVDGIAGLDAVHYFSDDLTDLSRFIGAGVSVPFGFQFFHRSDL